MGCGVCRDVEADAGTQTSRKGDPSARSAASAAALAGADKRLMLTSNWASGYFADELEGGTCATYEDYRAFTVTTSSNASKAKTDRVCTWLDQAHDAREAYGEESFFNPNNVKAWPVDLMEGFNSAGRFPPSVGRESKSPKIRSESSGAAMKTLA